MVSRDCIIIAEDMEVHRAMLSELFSGSHRVIAVERGDQVIRKIEECESSLSAVLISLRLPGSSILAILTEMSLRKWLDRVPVIVIASEAELDEGVRALEAGASDVITRPFEPVLVRRRVSNLIALGRHKLQVDDLVDRRLRPARAAGAVLVDALCAAAECRTLEALNHPTRVRLYAEVLLKAAADARPDWRLDADTVEAMAEAAALHDVGMVSLPDWLLFKPGLLSDEQRARMKSHTERGAELVRAAARAGGPKMLDYAAEVCRHHHERWDGGGYPDGLVGDDIPLSAQVAGLADVYDSLTRARVYKPAVSHERALQTILDGDCGAFSPTLMACLQAVGPQWCDIGAKHRDVAPLFPMDPFSALAPHGEVFAQGKYFAALNFLGGTAIELDLSEGRYQIVCAALGELRALPEAGTLSGELRSFAERMLTPDAAADFLRWIRSLTDRPWEVGSVEQSRLLTVRVDGRERPYRALLTRFDALGDERRALMVIAPNPASTSLPGHGGDERLRALMSLGCVLVELDFEADTASFSDNFHEVFGGTLPASMEEMRMDPAGAIYDGDRPEYLAALSSLTDGRPAADFEYRRRAADGSYLWCREQHAIRFGPDDRPVGSLGLVTLIEQYKRESAHFEAQARLDQLTVLYNKATTEHLIDRYLSQIPDGQMDALFIIDIDDFKYINDHYGHMAGDRVLKDISARIAEQFRKNDIVGRIGGDEFMVLLKHIPDRRTAHKKASAVLDALSELRVPPDRIHSISASVGMAISPDDGGDLKVLYQKADVALYRAKQAGKNQWAFYSSDTGSVEEAHGVVAGRIESRSEGMYDGIVEILLNDRAPREAMFELIDLVARENGLERAFVLDAASGAQRLIEWSRGVGRGLGRELAAGLAAECRTAARGRTHFAIESIDVLPRALREALRESGVGAALIRPIALGGEAMGAAGIASGQDGHGWTADERGALELIASLAEVAYFQRRQARGGKWQAPLNEAFDLVEHELYVVDEGFRLLRVNRALRARVGYRPGDRCYEALYGRATPCADCPIRALSRAVRLARSEIATERGRALVTVQSIDWLDGQSAFLLYARPLPGA